MGKTSDIWITLLHPVLSELFKNWILLKIQQGSTLGFYQILIFLSKPEKKNPGTPYSLTPSPHESKKKCDIPPVKMKKRRVVVMIRGHSLGAGGAGQIITQRFPNSYYTNFSKYHKSSLLYLKLPNFTLSEGQNMAWNLDFRGHLSTIGAESTAKS